MTALHAYFAAPTHDPTLLNGVLRAFEQAVHSDSEIDPCIASWRAELANDPTALRALDTFVAIRHAPTAPSAFQCLTLALTAEKFLTRFPQHAIHVRNAFIARPTPTSLHIVLEEPHRSVEGTTRHYVAASEARIEGNATPTYSPIVVATSKQEPFVPPPLPGLDTPPTPLTAIDPVTYQCQLFRLIPLKQDLREYLTTRPPLPLANRIRLLLAPIQGVAALHAQGLAHNDIKFNNIFVSANGSTALGDLDLTAPDSWANVLRRYWHIIQEAYGPAPYGTLGYEPHDQPGSTSTSIEADLWALGVLLCRVFAPDFVTPEQYATMLANPVGNTALTTFDDQLMRRFLVAKRRTLAASEPLYRLLTLILCLLHPDPELRGKVNSALVAAQWAQLAA